MLLAYMQASGKIKSTSLQDVEEYLSHGDLPIVDKDGSTFEATDVSELSRVHMAHGVEKEPYAARTVAQGTHSSSSNCTHSVLQM
jgi:hypothetical protein